MIQFHVCIEDNAAGGGWIYDPVILVLPAVHILGGRPGMALEEAGQGTERFWLSPRLQWRAHTLSYYQHCWSPFLLPGGMKEQWWNERGIQKKGEENTALKETDRRKRRKKQGQKGNGNRKWMGITGSWGSFLTVCFCQIAFGFRERRMEIHENL